MRANLPQSAESIVSEPQDRPFRIVPAARGLAWLLTAAKMLRMQAWRLLTVAVILQLILSLTRLPVLGLLIALAIPILSAGMLQSFHQVRRGVPLSPAVLFSPFADGVISARLFLLGGLIGLIAVILISWLLSGLNELQDPELIARLEQGDLDAVLALDPAVLQRAFLSVAIGIAVSGTIGYFAVPLVWFRRMRIAAAIGTGLKALVRNWLPFITLGLVLVVLSIPLMLLVGLVVGLTAVSGGPGMLQYALVLFVVLVIQLLMFGTQYCAYAEIFELGGELPPAEGEAPGAPDDQLVA